MLTSGEDAGSICLVSLVCKNNAKVCDDKDKPLSLSLIFLTHRYPWHKSKHRVLTEVKLDQPIHPFRKMKLNKNAARWNRETAINRNRKQQNVFNVSYSFSAVYWRLSHKKQHILVSRYKIFLLQTEECVCIVSLCEIQLFYRKLVKMLDSFVLP